MKPTELRIGNYLQDNQERLCTVESIHNTYEDVYAQGFKAPSIRGPVTSLPNKPIPITQGWLSKFGFTEKNGAYTIDFLLNKLTLIESKKGSFYTSFECGLSEDFFSIGSTIQYVHQLQNLYFALTQQELK